MATVLAGFLAPLDRRADYQFKGEASPRSASFFSIALREYLTATSREPATWLIMGTEKSKWDVLAQTVSTPDSSFETEKGKVAAEVSASTIDQNRLDQWGRELSRLLAPTQVYCELTYNAEEPDEQIKVWSALEKRIQENDEVIFDITHSLRHFAVISTFSVMLLRQLKNVKKVDFYYGALELTTNGISHVIHIPICQQLADATQAVATHTLTGDFRKLGECLGVGEDFNEKLIKVAYADELNRPKAEIADELLKELPNARSFLSEALRPKLKRSLEWIEGENLDIQYRHKAQSAFDCGQYFKAIAYLYEALLMAQMYFLDKKREDYLNFKRREDVREDLRKRNTYEPLFGTAAQFACNTYLQIEYLRNAVLHGTEAKGGKQSEDVERAIKHRGVLVVMLQNGFILFDALSDLVAKEELPALQALPPKSKYP